MIKQVIWSNFAESQLDEIFNYYEKKASFSVASKLLREIINAPNKLLNAPYSGQVEELLIERKIQYRYLVFKNYKLIYSVQVEIESIKIVDVFDTRQNPAKIIRSK